jgi:hypothetical protein
LTPLGCVVVSPAISMATSTPDADHELNQLLKPQELSNLNEILDNLPARPTPENLNQLFTNDLFHFLKNLNLKKFYAMLTLIVLIDFRSNLSRKAASLLLQDHHFHLCLKCSRFFSCRSGLIDHLREQKKHKVSSEKVTTKYKEANQQYGDTLGELLKELLVEKKSSGRGRRKVINATRRRLLALAEVSCLEKMIS